VAAVTRWPRRHLLTGARVALAAALAAVAAFGTATWSGADHAPLAGPASARAGAPEPRTASRPARAPARPSGQGTVLTPSPAAAAPPAAAALGGRPAPEPSASPGAPVPAPAAGVPAPPRGWSTVIADSFNGPAGSRPSSAWRYVTGGGVIFGTGEVETATDSTSNAYLDGRGDLAITARDGAGGWTSARIQTAAPVAGAPAGGELEVTASIEQPDPAGGLGYWPAFWMLGPGQWPEDGEIDILEDVNALSEHSGTLHCGTSPGGPCHEKNGLGSGLLPCPGCQDGFHTYTVIINRTDPADESVTWYLDGQRFYQVTEAQVGAAPWRAAVDHGFWIIFDLAVGGAYPDGTCGCTTPAGDTSPDATMRVAYVAAYVAG
jgi:beta-glucanase (GH16 family)